MAIPDRFFSGDLEITKSVTNEGMYRFKDQHGNTGYISTKDAEKCIKIVSSTKLFVDL
jgi:hypothetical protein